MVFSWKKYIGWEIPVPKLSIYISHKTLFCAIQNRLWVSNEKGTFPDLWKKYVLLSRDFYLLRISLQPDINTPLHAKNWYHLWLNKFLLHEISIKSQINPLKTPNASSIHTTKITFAIVFFILHSLLILQHCDKHMYVVYHRYEMSSILSFSETTYPVLFTIYTLSNLLDLCCTYSSEPSVVHAFSYLNIFIYQIFM